MEVSNNHQQLEQLYRGYLQNELSLQETELFFSLLDKQENEGVLKQLMDEEWDQKFSIVQPAPVRQIKKKRWLPVSVAAAVLLLLGIGTYFLVNNNNKTSTGTATVDPQQIKAPESNKATITLANGQTIYLDAVNNGDLATQGQVKIIKQADGSVLYEVAGNTTTSELQYNTLGNPRGSKVIILALSDGTKVWLNAESTIKYPVAFTGNDRVVEITGEAYFEVAHNATKPFHVLTNEQHVTVLGTHFNINSYDDEAVIKTTLLEGSVKVSLRSSGNEQRTTILKPGQQSQLSLESAKSFRITQPDLAQVMAWKDGWFEFDNTSLSGIMKQLNRWYDVDVVYESKHTQAKFGGRISKDLDLSNVLRMLESHGVKFKVEGRKVTVQ